VARVLITGSRGFTGRYLASELSDSGWEVWGTGLDEVSSDSNYLQLDICDMTQCRHVVETAAPDAVVHLAGLAFVDDDPAEIYRTNLLGTRTLLDALAGARPKPECVILASTANVYGNRTEGQLSESSPADPMNDYAVSKLAMEYMAALWHAELPIVITRPFNYTGVGQSDRFLIPKIVEHFRARAETLELGNLDVERDFSDVRYIAWAYRRLLEERPIGRTINLCSGSRLSLQEVLELAREITGHSPDILVNPTFVRRNEVRRLFGDPSLLRAIVGGGQHPTFRETLSWMLNAGVDKD
jgi:nucleoside-diphosphate-sugar epimerase